MAPAPTRRVENVSPEELYSVVQGLASQNPQAISTSEKRFKELLDMNGTFDGLHAIATSKNLPLPIRQQSIIQFKNAALSHWKSKRHLSDEQRVVIRARSLELLDEEDETIASCNKFIIGKLARQDYPNNWRNLLPDLTSVIGVQTEAFLSEKGNNPKTVVLLKRSLEVFNAIIKELTSVKMPGGIKIMGKVVEDYHLILQEHYGRLSANISLLLAPSTFASKFAADVIQLSHLSYKCLSKLACWLWQRLSLHKHDLQSMIPWMNSFFEASASQFQTICELRLNLMSAISGPPLHINPERRPTDPQACRSIEFLTRHLRAIGKFFRRIQQLSIGNFITLPHCSDLVLYGWSKVVQATDGSPAGISDSCFAIFPVRFLVQCMVLFRESLAQWSPNKRGPESGASLTQEFVEGAVKILVTRFIPLKGDDLEAWSSDPEEWVNGEDKESDQWEYELRPCAERVLMTMAIQYQGFVAPLLAMTFNEVAGQPSVDLESVIRKEAVYCAVGRCATRLKDVIPFEDWLTQLVSKEVRDKNPNFPILKRRIAWVIGKWIADECSTPNNPVIWDTLVHLLADREQGSDAVVRFAAASAIRECLDVLTFEPDFFLPHLANAVWNLVSLAAEADTVEAKRRVMQSLNVVIERMGTRIVPHIEVIAKPLPDLWTSASTDYLFKASLLETVTKLIESSKEASVSLNSVTIPLVQESFADGARLQLDSDALILWQAALRNATLIVVTPGIPSMFDILPMAILLLADNLDLLGSITGIVQSYVALDCVGVLQRHALDIFQAFRTAIAQAGMVNVKEMLVTLQLIIQTSPSAMWAEPMHVSGLFPVLIKTLGDDKASTTILTEHIHFFSRMAVCDATALAQLMAAGANEMGKPESELWKDLLDQWWQRFDNMSDPRHRKLAAMGIADLVATGRPEVLDRLDGEIINLWLDVFVEMKEALVELSDENASSTLSSLVTFWKDDTVTLPDWTDEFADTPEFARYQEIFKRDPVETEKLTVYVGARINHAQQQSGGEQAFQQRWLSKADPAVLKQLYRELTS